MKHIIGIYEFELDNKKTYMCMNIEIIIKNILI